mmetsp:Transcript_48049/g.112266  ORF Transcript_48049/g.112266 Transcript_48049/m.112266 type:complete len:247 (+) Transcript_48049:42-782(+)
MAGVSLDERAQAHILAFVCNAEARLCCRDWAAYIFQSLQLEYRVNFAKALHARLLVGCDQLLYHHSGVRPLGHEFEECVSYQFGFVPGGKYEMQWNRTFDGWTAESEQQVGTWRIRGDQVHCCTGEGPDVDASRVRFARPGLVFSIPVADVLCSRTAADQSAPLWEYAARGLPSPPSVQVVAEEAARSKLSEAQALDVAFVPVIRPDAHYVEVDGDLHEVCKDICEHWPEADWQRLMAIRLRFGLL